MSTLTLRFSPFGSIKVHVNSPMHLDLQKYIGLCDVSEENCEHLDGNLTKGASKKILFK